MTDLEIQSEAFQLARLRSERARVRAFLGVFAGLLVIVVIRGGMSLSQGHRGEAWPFALLLLIATIYETLWLRFIESTIRRAGTVSDKVWTASILIESLPPTIALLLQVHAAFVGPARALHSPAVLAYFLFIILSTLHLTPALSRLAGACSAAGYAFVSLYVFVRFPGIAGNDETMVYGTAFVTTAVLLVGGFAAGAVASQIRLHVVAALHEAENRAKIAQLQHDLGIARSIQQGLLPDTAPDVVGFDIAGWNRPADETGGDYFDWQKLADGSVAVTVADVTGHGVGSALCMAACRSYARAGLAVESNLSNFLGRMNQLLHQDLPSEKFVTFAAGVLHPSEATLRLVSAGHGPLLFYSLSENSFRKYDAQGLPLGLLPRATYPGCEELKFERGDILILVTDGFLEWANSNDEDFGEDRLKEVVREHREKPARTIISELYSAVLKFAGSMPQLDDLTALIVKRV